MARGVSALIFDLDGTLVDSAPDLHAAACAMLEEAGLGAVSFSQTRSFIGNGAPKLVERLLAATGGDPARHPSLLARFLHHYARDPVSRTRLYPGVTEALTVLQAAGHRMAICTNKPEAPARAVSEHFGLTAFARTIVGGDTLPVKKPDPAPLTRAATEIGADRILFVGDSETDSATARAAHVPFALFTEGYRKGPAESMAPDHLFDHFTNLPEIARAALPQPDPA